MAPCLPLHAVQMPEAASPKAGSRRSSRRMRWRLSESCRTDTSNGIVLFAEIGEGFDAGIGTIGLLGAVSHVDQLRGVVARIRSREKRRRLAFCFSISASIARSRRLFAPQPRDGEFTLIAREPTFDRQGDFVRFPPSAASQRALPHGGDAPPGFRESRGIACVALAVALQFSVPKITSRCWQYALWAVVTVPEAAVDEHDRSARPQHEVRRSRQRTVVEPVAHPRPMQRAPD